MMVARIKKREQWYGVRSVFLLSQKKDGTNVFEERVVVFTGVSVDRAFAKAQKEADRYAKALNVKRHPHMEAYIQDGDPLIDGYEVWSVLYESPAGLGAFYKERYDRCRHRPER